MGWPVMRTTVYVPRDAAALSLGAERVAAAIAAEAANRDVDLEIVRNGTRGLCWLEPLVEVKTSSGRIGYGPLTPADVPELFDRGFLDGAAHPRRVGEIDAVPYFAKQERLTFERVGLVDRPGGDRLGSPRPWRRGVPHRDQVEDGARRAGGAEVRHVQRG